jgi:hypothetical protein
MEESTSGRGDMGRWVLHAKTTTVEDCNTCLNGRGMLNLRPSEI